MRTRELQAGEFAEITAGDYAGRVCRIRSRPCWSGTGWECIVELGEGDTKSVARAYLRPLSPYAPRKQTQWRAA